MPDVQTPGAVLLQTHILSCLSFFVPSLLGFLAEHIWAVAFRSSSFSRNYAEEDLQTKWNRFQMLRRVGEALRASND